MKRSKRLSLGLVIVACLGLIFGTMASPQPAAAGWNGQQVGVSFQTTSSNCGGGYVTNVAVYGTNQNGGPGSWSSGVNVPWCGTSSVVTTGSWFKGATRVVLTYRGFNGGTFTRTCNYNVPTYYSSNVYWVTC